MDLSNKYVIAGTGSRSLSIAPKEHADHILTNLCTEIDAAKQQHPNLVMMSGGAEGFDHFITLAARTCNIPYVLCIPNTGYLEYYWVKTSQTHKNRRQEAIEMLDNCLDAEYLMEDVLGLQGIEHNGVHSNFLRNQRMVDLADAFFVYNPTSPGTRDCVQRIKQASKPWKEIR